MATANPTQFYEKVSEVEALSRYDHFNGQNLYQVPQEALSRNARKYERTRRDRRQQCEERCFYSYFEKRTVCDYWCPRTQ